MKFVSGRVEDVVRKSVMLFSSIFSFSLIIFQRLLFKGCENSGLYGKGLKLRIYLERGKIAKKDNTCRYFYGKGR